jgi:hypothetical protein
MENQIENEIGTEAGKAEHRLSTELSVIFACCYKLRHIGDTVLSRDQLALLQRIQKSAEAIRDLRPELTADAGKF